MDDHKKPTDQAPAAANCAALPDLTRLRYFHGQMLGANDFQTEQEYFRKQLKLINRCLHGYGTVCGLEVKPVKSEIPCDPKVERKPDDWKIQVTIECGLALDCEGESLVVKYPINVDLWKELNDDDRRRITGTMGEKGRIIPPIYLSICYCVQPLDPVRPVLPDACGAISECIYSKVRDTVRVKVSLEKPCADDRCETCCEACNDRCLVLAAIHLKIDQTGKGLEIAGVDNSIRRWLATYVPTTITGINWSHAGEYEPDDAEKILRDGMVVEFSRDVSAQEISTGIVDVIVYEGGKGRHAGIYFLNLDVRLDKNRLTFKQTSDEELQDGDRLLIILRADFILDACCYPVDGNHSGGKVPLLKGFDTNKRKSLYIDGSGKNSSGCDRPPRRYGAWVSGNGSPGGSFESWIFLKKQPKEQKPVEQKPPDETNQAS